MTDSDSIAATYNKSSTSAHKPAVTIIGAGPAGSLLSIFLARRGYRVTVYERLPDLRHGNSVGGRSINLALADRGIHALKEAGVFDAIEPLLIPMRGRMVHDHGEQTLHPYGRGPHEVIYSVSRSRLTAALLDCAERLHHVEFKFRQTCISVDTTQLSLYMQDIPTGRLYSLPLKNVIGADGAGSILRRYLVESVGAHYTEEMLSHGYKELTIPASTSGEHRLDKNALHVWPRSQFMLIALPNLDGSFTATLFLPHDGPNGFATLTSAAQLTEFFLANFPDAYAFFTDLEKQFFANPIGSMGTVRLDQWSSNDQVVLIGDAAHAIVPFHGQGMNCAFEDCVEFDRLLAALPGDFMVWSTASALLQATRKPNADAIATMALENYIVMRDSVRDPKYQLQQALALELEQRFPERFIPRYSMVMFHHEIPYEIAMQRGSVQEDILRELTMNIDASDAVDYQKAAELIEANLPLLT